MNKYIEKVLNETRAKNANEPEFLQTVEEVLSSLEPVIEAHPEYEKVSLLERMVEPERVIEFRVTWEDDNHNWQVNRGYRVQYNGALGPYKGGIRFDPSVNLSIIKFLGFEQTFKDAMTGLPIGGAKGGSDFDPRGRSEAEVMRFCQAFITELYRHIGQDIDCPAGDLGCGGREINYMYGQYRRIVGASEFGALSGKSVATGGSLMRPEATGYGAVYYLDETLKFHGDDIKGKKIAISGYGNVGWGIMQKVAELGGMVTYFAGPDGYIHDPDGVVGDEKLNYILEMRAKDPMHCAPYAEKFGCEFVPGQKCWGVKDVDVYMPAATQNDVNMEWAEKIAASGVKYYIEVANMPTTNDALEFLKKQPHLVVAPSKAVNAGGVSVSELEMAQNAERLYWTAGEVDEKLKGIMKNIFNNSVEVAKRYNLTRGEGGKFYDLVAAANILGFQKVADAMMAQGIF
ncbi:NADP-specific glutamate dehydrogenase [Pseudoflavonifractor sp. 60]|uniref:NADP-specific glutamate dehydrogenase n=1 Tax=Pseudoflavonifractor sp. 60 TaxID=2304576 RepID=UPI001370B644|nr:NADP-specific glutamate dehydrogenase [Pseudoflavonifractor sp. 60]NBI67774.1 NADP-specific glutamate dehydrogenase [Pseudoflavonifractor sp. 60]